MKYVVMKIEVDDLEYEHPFVFPDMLNHDQFAENIQHMILMNHEFASECISAGFCNFFGQEPTCGGRSETLNIESRCEVDDRLISMFNYQHGAVF